MAKRRMRLMRLLRKLSIIWFLIQVILLGALLYPVPRADGITDENHCVKYRVHYKGWKKTWDDWVPPLRLLQDTVANRAMHADVLVIVPGARSRVKWPRWPGQRCHHRGVGVEQRAGDRSCADTCHRLSRKATGIARQNTVVRKSDKVKCGESGRSKDSGENKPFRLSVADTAQGHQCHELQPLSFIPVQNHWSWFFSPALGICAVETPTTSPRAPQYKHGLAAQCRCTKPPPLSKVTGSRSLGPDRIAKRSSSRVEAFTGTKVSSRRIPPSAILKGCVVYVDVISASGDASVKAFITEKLQDMGARVLNCVGHTLTHIVYKNGLGRTLNLYRRLPNPKPLVVGMEWVVQSEKIGTHVDETSYLIEIDDMNTTGTKRPKAMLPRSMSGLDNTDAIPRSSVAPLEKARLRKAATLTI
ncbi:hypothetical protein B0H13DRAFT_2385114 [Mycena leptocephala]|nr:hypothetical protein B0H13DRAFT_2385114 [Mycena leptocephala]